MKLRKCRCGGEVVLLGGEPWDQSYHIQCKKCNGIWHMGTYSPKEAMDEWGYEQICSNCIWFNGEVGDGWQFCDDKEEDVSENWSCYRWRKKEQ